MSVFHYLIYRAEKESNSDLSFSDFIQKLKKLQKTYTIRQSVCNTRNKRVISYLILLQKKAA